MELGKFRRIYQYTHTHAEQQTKSKNKNNLKMLYDVT